MLITLLATIVVLGVLIFVHELGHFMAAKWVDIEVPRFSIGLGPKMIGFKRGETEYVISWLPLGGYVKMAGMEEMEKLEGGPSAPRAVTGALTADDTGIEAETAHQAGPRDFESKSLPARTLVITAGVIMNLLFAVLLFAVSAMIWGVQTIAESRVGNVSEELLPAGAEALASLPPGTRIVGIGSEEVNDFRDLTAAFAKVGPGPIEVRFENQPAITVQVPSSDSAKASLIGAFEPSVNTPAIIGRVVENTPASKANLRAGDRVLRADGQPVASWQDFVARVENKPGQPLQLDIERDGNAVSAIVVPDAKDLRGKRQYGRLGVFPRQSAASALPREKANPLEAVGYGFSETWNVVALTVDFLRDLFTGNANPRNVGGVIQIGQLSGQVARAGLEPFLAFMALFSVNLAVLNLLPIPVLDGGHLMFLGYEAIRRRPLSIEQRMRLSQVGFVIVLAIMVWAIANDVLRLFGL